ncbi:MAG TPA: ABC transporter ATP-binding protein [Candidatus Udaeobacter sp.]|nr:ABC transporter ATP-binding protein [Candidatus Udaeobacter sp.]
MTNAIAGASTERAPAPAVAAVQVSKRFPGVVANDRVTFEAATGEIHALLGENGAGKTTLCNILTGLYRPDEGEVQVGGHPVRFRSPKDAHEAQIFMVHQHLRLVESMTVAENVVLGWSRGASFRFAPRAVDREIAQVAEQYHMPVNPSARIWQLSMGERQRVEILKGLYRGARILILDEPTTVLTPQEADQLFESLREMTRTGGTVIFISHKLPEVFAVSDRITILRKGRSIATLETADCDAGELATLMVGQEVPVPTRAIEPGEAPAQKTVLELEDISAQGDLGVEALHGVSVILKAGEILGVAGVAGNGQRELAEVIAGLRPATHGTVRLDGSSLPNGDVRAAIDRGIAYIPEDRMGTGCVPDLSIKDNIILKSYRDSAMRFGPVIRRDRAAARTKELMQRFDVRAPGADTLIRQLSGGNVQRVLLARELSASPRVLIAASPTRGLDVRSTHEIRGMLIQTAESGAGVLLISEDLDEILQIADRIAVLSAGRIAGIVDRATATLQELGLMMTGAAA